MFTVISEGRSFSAKLANMRKPQDFVIYPRKDGEPVTIQSDKSIGQFDETGKGRLNTNGCYFVHIPIGIPFQFPQEIVDFCLKKVNKSGDELQKDLYLA